MSSARFIIGDTGGVGIVHLLVNAADTYTACGERRTTTFGQPFALHVPGATIPGVRCPACVAAIERSATPEMPGQLGLFDGAA